MRLQYFGNSTQEVQFAAMLSDRALEIMKMRSQVNQDEMCSSNSSNLDNTSPQFLRAEGTSRRRVSGDSSQKIAYKLHQNSSRFETKSPLVYFGRFEILPRIALNIIARVT